jgi:hypothetical protein
METMGGFSWAPIFGGLGKESIYPTHSKISCGSARQWQTPLRVLPDLFEILTYLGRSADPLSTHHASSASNYIYPSQGR